MTFALLRTYRHTNTIIDGYVEGMFDAKHETLWDLPEMGGGGGGGGGYLLRIS